MNTETLITKNFVFAQIVQHYSGRCYEIAVLAKSLVWNISYQHAKLTGKCIKIIFDNNQTFPNEEGFISGNVEDFLFFEPDLIVSFYQ